MKKILCMLSLFILAYFCGVLSMSFVGNRSVNNVAPLELENGYSFFVAGHIYGAPNLWESVEGADREQVYPAASLLASVDMLNGAEADFMILMGDNVLYGTDQSYNVLEDSFLSKLDMPVYSVIGNHDVMGVDSKSSAKKRHSELFGDLYSSFKVGTEYFIFLDTGDSESAALGEDQLSFLEDEILAITSDDSVENVFVLTHKSLWVAENRELEQMMYWYHPTYKMNILKGADIGQVYPRIIELAQDKNVYWGSGDIKDLYPAFYHYDESTGITFFANSLNDSADDMVFRVSVVDSKVSFNAISLYDGESIDANHFGEEMWTAFRGF